MIIVTGGAGFIGSNLLRFLNQHDEEDLLVVDDLTDGTKFANMVDTSIAAYMDKEEFLVRLKNNESFGQVRAVLHQGACSDTTEWNGRLMMDDNYHYSCALFDYCQQHAIPLIYASTAAIYGVGDGFSEIPKFEKPLNVYGYSKLLFDQYVRQHSANQTAQVVGLRYFNVYGPNEQHKGHMASVAFHFSNQLRELGVCRLFAGNDGYSSGEQRRDFVYVDDVCQVIGWFLLHPEVSGIYNVGTGQSQTFNEMARAVVKWFGTGQLQYIPFPEHLAGSYQSFTEADLSQLRETGCDVEFVDVQTGVSAYFDRLYSDHKDADSSNSGRSGAE